MSKRNPTSPVKQWPGTITIKDPVPLLAVVDLEETINEARKAEGISQAAYQAILMPGVLGCIERVDLEGLPEHPTVEDMPGTPRLASAQLMSWMVGAVMDIYTGEEEVPEA